MDDNQRNAHQLFAIEAFNGAWELIEKPDRTPDDDAEMLQRAVASRWHWGFVGGPAQLVTGDWQIAHVASLLGLGQLAWMYANRALAMAEANGFTDFGRASVLEGMARAAAVYGDAAAHAKYYELAKEAIDAIEEDGERAVIASQFATVPLP